MILFNPLNNKNKPIFLSLKNVYGLNFFLVNKTLKKLGISKNLIFKNINKKLNLNLINTINIKKNSLSTSLKKFELNKLNFLLKINTVKINRLIKSLPINGQRTKTNAKTAKKKNKQLFENVK